MNKFELYLFNDGIQLNIANRYGRIVDDYINWLNTQGLTPKKVKKRSQFMGYLRHCYSIGNKRRTVICKETAIKRYYEFLGTKFNPAHTWKKRKKVHPSEQGIGERRVEQYLRQYQTTYTNRLQGSLYSRSHSFSRGTKAGCGRT